MSAFRAARGRLVSPLRIESGEQLESFTEISFFSFSPAVSQPYLRYSIVYIARSTVFTAYPSRDVRHTYRLV